MKRFGPLTRKTPLQSGSRLSRSTPMEKNRTPLKKVNPERVARKNRSYSKTLRSAKWRGVRTAVLMRADFRCEKCGYEPEHWTVRGQVKCPELHVHHAKGYDGFGGGEDLSTLHCLCRNCHMAEHGRAFFRPRGLRGGR